VTESLGKSKRRGDYEGKFLLSRIALAVKTGKERWAFIRGSEAR